MKKEKYKTLATMSFEFSKKNGFVKKVGKARVRDGMRYLERTLYHDSRYDEYIVMVDGNAYHFRFSLYQDNPDLIKGFI